MAAFDHLQQILGTNKKNRVFSIHRHSETGYLHVYFGLELFEVLPDDREDIRFKLMIAHMHNAGASYAELERAFSVDPRVTKRWSRAFKSGNAEILANALAGVNAGRKLSKSVEAYVRIRFPHIYADDRYTYSSKMRSEIKEGFDVELSAETLRPLLKELKDKFNLLDNDKDKDGSPEPEGDDTAPRDGATDRENREDDEENSASDDGTEPRQTGHSRALPEADFGIPTNRNQFVDFLTPRWSSHLGLLIYGPFLLSLQRSLKEEYAPAVCQWAGHVLLGAANIEQTKLHSRSDLGDLFGVSPLGNPSHQRQKLSELARAPDLAQDVLRWNFEHLGGNDLSDFYFDPHTKHYTGTQNVLKGWCSKLRWAEKIMNGDYVHTTSGAPIYLENTDNYEDIRQRFKGLEGRFRDCFKLAEDRKLTWIIDRGIFSQEIFEWIAEHPNTHLITWEKGYQRDAWKDGVEAVGSFSVERARNHNQDLKTYQFEWIEEPWPTNPKMRRFLVRATNPGGNQIEVSILCDDPDRPAKEMIWLMFDRWVQENDFKYMDSHFGINQITSYQSETYAEIRDELEDRLMKNAAYTALENSRRDARDKAAKLLYQNRESRKKEELLVKKIKDLETIGDRTAKQNKELGSFRGARKSGNRHCENRDQKIKALDGEIDRISIQMENTGQEVSRLDTLIERGAVRLIGSRKYLMDVIKLTCRNIFYQALGPFKEKYDNYRDDHVWFRHLTQSPGLIEETEDGELKCQLISPADYPKQVRNVIEKMLLEITASGMEFLDASERKIKLILGQKSSIGNAIPNEGFKG